MEELQSILSMWQQSWHNPAMRHALLAHFPIVLSVLLVPLALLTAFWPASSRKTLMIFCFLIGFATAGTAWVTKDAGSAAHAALGNTVSQDVEEKIIAHDTAEAKIWWLALSSCGLLTLACFGNKIFRGIARLLFFLSTVALAGYIGYVADLGARLVYVDRVGVGIHPMDQPPPQPAAAPTPPASEPAPIAAPPSTTPLPSTSTPPNPTATAVPNPAATQARQVLSQAGLYEAKPGFWYLKQVNGYSPRIYNRLSTDGDVRAALRSLGGQLPPRGEWASPPPRAQ